MPRKRRLKMGWVNDPSVLASVTSMAGHWFTVCEQLNAAGVNASRQHPSDQVGRHRIAVALKGHHPFPAHHYRVEEAVVACALRYRAKLGLLFLKQDGRRLPSRIRRPLLIHLREPGSTLLCQIRIVVETPSR
jgi:hypothetical protein